MKIRIPKIVRENVNLSEAPGFLICVSDQQPGIKLLKKGKGFRFLKDKEPVRDAEELSRIKKLAIPPAWKNVWVCGLSNGHLQSTGFDLRNRKHYRYHSLWSELHKQTKFHKMLEFGKILPILRLKLEKDIAFQEKRLQNKKLARIIQQCLDIPGKFLFQYYEEYGDHKLMDSSKVNHYVKDATDEDFTAKDFRTRTGSLQIIRAFRSIGDHINETDKKSKINQTLTAVSILKT